MSPKGTMQPLPGISAQIAPYMSRVKCRGFLWSAVAERSGDTALALRGAGKIAFSGPSALSLRARARLRRKQKRCRRFALPPHSIWPFGDLPHLRLFERLCPFWAFQSILKYWAAKVSRSSRVIACTEATYRFS